MEIDLTNKENLAARIGAIGERFIPVKSYTDTMPVPRLVEGDLKAYMGDIDSQLSELHTIEEEIRKLAEHFPSVDEDPKVWVNPSHTLSLSLSLYYHHYLSPYLYLSLTMV